jgi:hypothetical protein
MGVYELLVRRHGKGTPPGGLAFICGLQPEQVV